ncbi:hypothetical protein [Pantoea sp. CCBC3-3-1]|uniref:hypothetical protein n=1 Tax=Pantoea sp. CCBC3-3-1 TaxID=2490851 RepID=UPI0011BF8178|nr:hypothetical protein [Pantoea sp. CCBC3-3-1]
MKIFSALMAVMALAGCSHEQVIYHRDDYYDRNIDSISIFNSATLQDAQAKANRFCNAKAFAIPELREKDLQRLQAEKDYLKVEPAAYHFVCKEMEAMFVRGRYGDKTSQARYEQLSKAQSDEATRQGAEDYKRLKQAARAPGYFSSTEKLPDGSIMTRSWGNGVICESFYSETGGYTSCDDVDE